MEVSLIRGYGRQLGEDGDGEQRRQGIADTTRVTLIDGLRQLGGQGVDADGARHGGGQRKRKKMYGRLHATPFSGWSDFNTEIIPKKVSRVLTLYLLRMVDETHNRRNVEAFAIRIEAHGDAFDHHVIDGAPNHHARNTSPSATGDLTLGGVMQYVLGTLTVTLKEYDSVPLFL